MATSNPEKELNKEVAEIALQELGEDTTTKEQCLEHFREWIRQNKDIENCPTDDIFLLRFLRVRKYSLHLAQQTLLKYLNLRRCFKYIFYNMDCLDDKLYQLIDMGYCFVSPFRDRSGRRVSITISKRFDTSRFTSTDMARLHLIMVETLVEDEETQVLGMVHLVDYGDVSTSIITIWSPNEFARLVKWGEQSFPMRHKEVHVLNVPSFYQYVLDFILSRLSQKLKNRFKLHASKEELHKVLDPHVLPKEYGGVMPMAEMIELYKKELQEKRARLLSFDQINLLSDQGIIGRHSKVNENGEIDNMSGSFRKLEVD